LDHEPDAKDKYQHSQYEEDAGNGITGRTDLEQAFRTKIGRIFLFRFHGYFFIGCIQGITSGSMILELFCSVENDFLKFRKSHLNK
jgi:hypothetical protein